MKVIIFSDWHVHQFKQFNSNKDRLANCVKVLADICEFANRNSIDYIFFAGDLYDTQKVLLTEVVNAVVEAFRKMHDSYPHIQFIAISGNHDHSTKNLIHAEAETALKHLSLVIPNFILLDNSYVALGNGIYLHGIPYYELPEHFGQALDRSVANLRDIQEPEAKHYLLMHQTPEDKSNPMIPADISPEDERFGNFVHVYCGHIHSRKDFEGTNFTLVGNPIHKDLSDAGKDKGFIVRNLAKPEKGHIFIKLKGYPEFKYSDEVVTEEEEVSNFIVPVAPEMEITEEKKVQTNKFKADLQTTELITNFWELADGKDEELLKQGLKYITNG